MYSIYADGACIYSDVFAVDSMKVINPKLTLEDNGAGSLVVTLPPHNAGYASIVRMVTDISVQKDGEEIWAGRVLSESEDFYRNRILYCEGELAYFNDSTQPPAEYSGMSVRGYLERLIAVHNSKVAANRRFTLGAVTVVDKNFPTYYTNHDKTMAVFNAMVEQYGGHLRVRKVDGVRYLDYLAEYPDTCSQVIQFGSNIIDFTKQWDSTEFATVIVPLGNRLEDSPIEALDAYLTVESVNHGIVADYITTGVLNADVIRAGTLKDYGGNFILDFETGKLTMKRGSINIGNGNFTVDEEGNLYARRGTFAGTLSGAKGTFGGQLVAASGDFKGVVQASDFLDRYGRSMMSGDKFASDYLDLYGLTIRNKNTGATTFAVSSTGVITINGNITMGAGSTINWAAVSNQNLAYNPAYSLADTANTRANRALSDASDAYDMADAAFARANQAYRMADSIEMPSYIRSTYIDSTTIRSPVIEGGEFYGGEFNVIAGGNSGSFNLYGPYGSSRFHMFSISYYDAGVWGPYIYVSSPCGGTICFDGNVEFTGNVEFASAHVHGLSSD